MAVPEEFVSAQSLLLDAPRLLMPERLEAMETWHLGGSAGIHGDTYYVLG